MVAFLSPMIKWIKSITITIKHRQNSASDTEIFFGKFLERLKAKSEYHLWCLMCPVSGRWQNTRYLSCVEITCRDVFSMQLVSQEAVYRCFKRDKVWPMSEKATLMFRLLFLGHIYFLAKEWVTDSRVPVIGFFKDWHPDANQTKRDQRMFSEERRRHHHRCLSLFSQFLLGNAKTHQPTKSYLTARGQEDTVWEKEILRNPPASASPVAGITDIFYLIRDTTCFYDSGAGNDANSITEGAGVRVSKQRK